MKMKGTILLNHNQNTKKIEDEEKSRFLKNILEQMGVSVEEFWNSEVPLSVDQKIKLRGILSTYNVQVIDNLDGLLQIYVEDQLVAEWHKPLYKLKRDLCQIDPRKQLYLEMKISCWSLFEESGQE